MDKYEAIHVLYERCQTIEFNEVPELMRRAKTDEERTFYSKVTDIILQQKQKKVIAEGRF